MFVQQGTISDIEPWSQLRAALWPERSAEAHRDDIIHSILGRRETTAGFVAISGPGELIGFAEAALRHDYVNGCETSPVLFLEGIYVRPADRRDGVARSLCGAVAAWGKSAGCMEFASDASLDNLQSHAMHAALGFKETERVVFFRKRL